MLAEQFAYALNLGDEFFAEARIVYRKVRIGFVSGEIR